MTPTLPKSAVRLAFDAHNARANALNAADERPQVKPETSLFAFIGTVLTLGTILAAYLAKTL